MDWLELVQTGVWADWVVVLAVALAVVCFCLRGRKGQMQKLPRKDGMVGFRLIYADQKQSGRQSFGRLLTSQTYGLRGKPDFVYRRRWSKRPVPVEIKSGTIGDNPLPHVGDYLQLAAYFLLLEDVYGSRPTYGWLRYQDYMFFIRNTRKVRKDALQTMQKMRRMLSDGRGEPNADFIHCRHCVCNGTVCPYGTEGRNGGEE